jgi:hypothetical protein
MRADFGLSIIQVARRGWILQVSPLVSGKSHAANFAEFYGPAPHRACYGRGSWITRAIILRMLILGRNATLLRANHSDS